MVLAFLGGACVLRICGRKNPSKLVERSPASIEIECNEGAIGAPYKVASKLEILNVLGLSAPPSPPVVRDIKLPNRRGSHILSSWMVHAGCVVVAGIHPSRT